jgi:muconate cycloisomerase
MNAPRIQAIEAILVDLPTIREHKLAMTTMQRQSLVIVRLRCDDGVEGLGEATTIGGLSYTDQSPEGIKLAIDTYLTPALLGKDATNINAVMAVASIAVQGHSFAKSAIETALWDALGHRMGQPIHRLLGGAARQSLPVLWTLASGNSARDIGEARELIAERRHNVFKLKVGRRALAEDVAHVIAIKSALGPDVRITVDANQAWSEAQAVRAITELEAAGIDLIEQPVSRRNRRGLARLAARFDVPIMADEAIDGPEDAFDLAAEAAADVYSLKIAKAGGLLATLRTAAVAGAAHVAVYGGTMLEGSIGSIASAHAFAACPELAWGTELFGPLLLRDDVVVERPTYHDFALHLSDKPGLGVQIDADKLAHYRRDRASPSIHVSASKAA